MTGSGNAYAWGTDTTDGFSTPPEQLSDTSLLTFSDTLQIQFRLNKSDLDRDFMRNGAVIDSFVTHVLRHYRDVPADSLRLDIYAGASPEGPAALNRRLGERRGQALRHELQTRLGSHIGTIVIHNEAARWQAFGQAIARSSEPWRDEVLAIVRTPIPADESPYQLSSRELRLRRLHGGTVWPVLLHTYLPPLRSSGTGIVSIIHDRPASGLVMAVADTLTPPSPLPLLADQPILLPADTLLPPVWAVKTNLLFDAVLAPNVAVEYPLGSRNRWSIEAEYVHPWWIFNHNARAEQLFYVGLELRYWLGNRRRHPWLDGHHIGLSVGTGYYDFEWKKRHDTEGSRAGYRGEGYQGEPVVCFLNYGWQHRFARHWAVDLGLGIGLLTTRYRHYIGDHDNRHLMWQNNGRWTWAGPVHANLSIVYTIDLPHKLHWVRQLLND